MFMSSMKRMSFQKRRNRSRSRTLLCESLERRSLFSVLTVTTPLDIVNPNDGVLSLREAVIQANASKGTNTIVVPAGTYMLSLAGTFEDAALTGDLDLTGHL